MTQWFWADTPAATAGLSLALNGASVGACPPTSASARWSQAFGLTFIGWLDQRLAAELYVTARDEDEARRLREWLPHHSTAFANLER